MKIFEGVKQYDWVPFFKELSTAIKNIGNEPATRKVILKQKALAVFGPAHAINKFETIDPFSFIYSLAQKITRLKKDEMLSRVIAAFKLTASMPTDTIFPTPQGNADTCFFWKGTGYINKQGEPVDEEAVWRLFGQAILTGILNGEDFQIVISLKGVGVSKLTQTLFLINPVAFWCIDDNALWLPHFHKHKTVKEEIESKGLAKYKQVLKDVQNQFPGCSFFEINLLCRLLSGNNPDISLTGHYCQISSKLEGANGQDFFDEFVRENAVWPGDSGSNTITYGLSKPEDGDIVLIRRGIRNLGGIGLVILNEFNPLGYNPDHAIKIIWLNKQYKKLDYGLGDRKGFNENATQNTIDKFGSQYTKTFTLIDNIRNLQNIKMAPSEFLLSAPPSLNTILYGPPGTGKTYHTITKAAEIITGESFEKRYDEAKVVYKDALAEQQIEFVTFHQNYSYEDFVAGLRPNADDTNQLSFKEHKGVFYRISQLAKENFLRSQQGDHPAPDFNMILERFLSPLNEPDGKMDVPTLGGKSTFTLVDHNDTHIDYLRGKEKKERTLRINRVKEFFYKQKVNTTGGPNNYHEAFANAMQAFAATNPIEISPTELKNYVLIIDEINRANISRVFGELITLLEPDKRLGADNELTLRLPGLPDDELFGVPPNLYIVGTMNTADKSIALIDIALRRRFVFEDMYPRKEIVNEVVPEQYRTFLLDLNEAIRKQKSADFMIGHAYFIPEKDKELNILQVLNQKVIPLLNEYFYNQRNNPVWNLLSPFQNTIAGIEFEQDDFIGVKAKAV